MDFHTTTTQFEQWLLDSGCQVSPKVQIADLRDKAQGRGLLAVEDIKEDEILFSIPRKVMLNVETGTLGRIEAGNKEKLLTKYNHWDGLILTILFELSLGEQSRWAPYFRVLPHEFHSLMFWTQQEVNYLKPSLVVSRIGRDKAEENYYRLFPAALEDLGIPHLQVSLNKFHQVASTIMSYSFDVERPDFDEDEEDDELVKFDGYFKSMVALADILNADTKLSNANLFYEHEVLVMKAVTDINKGDQIYNTYGDHPNSELLRRYGFVEWDGSKFDFGEIPISTIHETIVSHFGVEFRFVESILEIISECEVEEIEEDIVLDSYDVYNDGDVSPEAQLLLQVLVIIAQVSPMEDLENVSRDTLSKTVNRVLKKCYQLIESGSMTKKCAVTWEQCVTSRLSVYPSHAFRDLCPPQDHEHFSRLRMSECILKSEVSSLQAGLRASEKYRLIDDAKLIGNILKRKAGDVDVALRTKRQKV